ncbi:MAG: HAMP domain-containing protein [Cyanobacteria bacterium TGS_CYA1]|nr:HAMP domain-containing protein [Cyanobacteria bacterium TGS_CYA1]
MKINQSLRLINQIILVSSFLVACIAVALWKGSPEFLAEQGTKLSIAAFILFIVVASCAILIPRRILSSIEKMKTTAKKMSAGDWSARIEIEGDEKNKDELSILATELNELAEAMEKRNNAQRQWIANTSHELRTPLSIIQAQVEAFQDGVREVNPKSLNTLHKDILGLAKLVEDLHWLARFDIGTLRHSSTPTDLVATLQESIDSFSERFLEKQIEIEMDMPSSSVVNGDQNRLKQVFFNLLENSLRYTNEGGKLKVTLVQDNNHATIYFDDSEPGAPQETLAQMFDRFFRGEVSRSRTYGGSGLGLSICKNIIEIHNGSIQAQNSPFGGVRIEIILPLAATLAEQKHD